MEDLKKEVLYLIHTDLREQSALVRTGYYSKVKHIIEKYSDDGKFLIQSEVFLHNIILYFKKPGVDIIYLKSVII
jgi:hypothetical protein